MYANLGAQAHICAHCNLHSLAVCVVCGGGSVYILLCVCGGGGAQCVCGVFGVIL